MTSDMTSETQPQAPGLPQPSPRMADLAFFLGDWRATGTFHETPFGPRKPIEMRIRATDEDRGFWFMVRTEEIATPENPAPLTARYLWGYDQASGEFVADWFDSNGSHAVQRSAGWDGDRLVFEGTITNSGMTIPLRDTFTRLTDARYHHIGEIDLGAGWIPVDDEEVVRSQVLP